MGILLQVGQYCFCDIAIVAWLLWFAATAAGEAQAREHHGRHGEGQQDGAGVTFGDGRFGLHGVSGWLVAMARL